ncbi:hypothetical protein KB681_gp15 [Burkholderia phage Mica]|uniref:Uncharacterized protein n=1 Tax=Burkholderia phage Mica TaxID=2767579 RepID=A0A873WEY3_9CAUD|nr:hypothetical protein KB681_gp15 [Burkholderia phage Mica]QPB08628.1 hypothetical protein CPT_Mica_015 [Burkholderia phage Mica]
METIADLERALAEYRNGERALPSYAELAALVAAHESAPEAE